MLFGGAVACGLAVWGVRNLGVETDYLGFFSPRDHVRVENREISEKLAGTQPLSVVVTGDEPRAVTRLRVLRAIHELQRYVETLPGVDTTLSLVDYLYLVRRALDPEAPPLPASQEEIEQLLLLVDPAEIEGVANRDLSRANVVVRTRLSSSGDIDALVDNITAFAREHFPRGVTVRPTGTIVLLARSADALVRGQVTGLWQVVFVLFVLMSVLFLSLRVGLLSLVPNVVPILLLFGLMGWWGFDLNISTALIAALAIGIAVDDTIHYLTAFNAGLRKTADQAKAVAEAARTVGSPIVFTSVALAAGFLVVCLSNFRPVQDFGLLSATTMGIALLSDLVLTPAVLMTTKIVTLWEVLFLKLGPEPHKQIPLFHGLRPFQAKIVVLMARLANAPAGTAITRRGELRDELYVLLGGRAEVRRDAEGPVLRSLGRGDVVGEMGLVRHQPRTADVIVVEEAEYLILDRAFLRRLPRRYPRIAARVFLNLTRILSDRLETTTDQLAAARPARAAS
ncbi:MAG: hypothetical protein KatS3mg076_1568 [Candidatus Binatia bacterium]|nr:MAG: hypothetical protein KatS3mg076_1568 [Candidatus Binatia bacterium]